MCYLGQPQPYSLPYALFIHDERTYLLTDFQVILPGTSAPEVGKVLLEPDLQIEGSDLVPSLPEKVQSQAAVDATAQKDSHLETFPSTLLTSAEMTINEKRCSNLGGAAPAGQ